MVSSLIILDSLNVNMFLSIETRLLDSDSSLTFGTMDFLQKLSCKSLGNHKVRGLSHSYHTESTYEHRSKQLLLTSETMLANPLDLQKTLI
jgi:hypothetical protein